MDDCFAFSKWRALFAAVFILFAAPAGGAQVWAPGFGAFKHFRAAADDGAPDGVLRVAQTKDGYMWFAGDALYRFDGATFELIDWDARAGRRRASPSALMVDKRGELWVGLRDSGGVAIYRRGSLVDMHLPNPPRGIAAFAEGLDGSVWATSLGLDKRLLRLRGSRWERMDEVLRLRPGYIMNLRVLHNGVLIIALSEEAGAKGRLMSLAPSSRAFVTLPVPLTGRPQIELDRDGFLWASDRLGVRRVLDPQGRVLLKPAIYPPIPAMVRAAITFDRDGAIWGTTGASGIFRIANPLVRPAPPSGPVLFRAANGLTSDITYTPFLDREGNVWIGTESGIDQFRRASAIQAEEVPPDPINGLAIAREANGSVLIASRGTVYRIDRQAAPRALLRVSDQVSLCPAWSEGTWIIEAGRTRLWQSGHTREVEPYPGGEARIACTEDGQGRLWLGLASGKILWRDQEGWHETGSQFAGLNLWDLTTTNQGELAIITPPNVAVLRGERLEYIRLEKTGIGTPWAILPGTLSGSRDLFVSGAGGLARVRGTQVRQLLERRFPWITWVRTLQQTPSGETWLFSRAGAFRVATEDLDRAFDDPRAPLPHTKFDALDGLASTVQQGGFAGQQSALSGDGRIWFLNRQGAAYIDPSKLQKNELPPPVVIRSASTDRQTWRDPFDLVLPAGTRTITFAYAGLSFTVPQRVKFRYMLEGADDSWIDAGARRTATYSNLGPGKYRFRVIASNNDGVWNRTGAVLAFEIRPTFVESWPFRLLCLAGLVAALWLIYAARLRSVSRGIRARFAERVAERERIARELHDTLLQAVQSLTLRFQLAADDLPPDSGTRLSLVQAIDNADAVIADGRDRVRELRSEQDGDLNQILCDTVARTAFPAEIAVEILTFGSVRALDASALEEVSRIATEALFNVRKHAKARAVRVEARYGSAFELRILDDGEGIDPKIAEELKRDGHFGLVGMTERAAKLRGELRVARRSTGGTELVLKVRGSVAYKSKPSLWRL